MRWVLLAILLLTACRTPAPPPPAPTTPVSPLVRIEVVRDPSAAGPMVVAMHGLGGGPEGFQSLFGGYSGSARLIFPAAPTPYGDGYSWFPTRVRDGRAEVIAAEVGVAADQVAVLLQELIAAHPDAGKPVVTGFSQGGMLSFALATRHPDLVGLSIPLAGWLPPDLWPEGGPPEGAPPIRALHGSKDTVLPLEPTMLGVESLAARGWDVELTVFNGVEHRMTRDMTAELYRLVDTVAAAGDPR